MPEAFDPGRSDPRFSPHAERISGLLGERVSESYSTGRDPDRFRAASSRHRDVIARAEVDADAGRGE